MANQDGIRSVSIQPHEILLTTSRFIVEATLPLDPDASRDALSVKGERGTVRLDRGGRRLIWKPRRPLPAGRYVLKIGELISTRGRRLTSGRQVPFAVVETRARVPGAVVRSFARLAIEDLVVRRLHSYEKAKGKYLEMVKATVRGKRSPVALAFDARGRRVNAEKILQEVQVKRVRRFGKLHEHLYRRLREAGPRVRLPVAMWVVTAERPRYPTQARPRRGLTAKPPAEIRARLRKFATTAESLIERLRQMGTRDVRLDRAAPVVNGWLTPSEIRSIQRRPDVAAIFLRDPRGFDDLQNSIAVASSNVVHAAGVQGADVRVAVWERHPATTGDLLIADQFDSSPDTSDHSTLTHAIIANTQARAPHGHAPSCLLHSANSYDLDALEWAVLDEGCTVISQSFHRTEEQTDGGLSYDDIYKDWLALHWPWPTIVQAAGNGADDEFVNHKGYNSLGVANHDDTAAGLATDSVFRNPDAPHADRELPEISANGTTVTAAGETDSGTSFAAPAVAGVAALLQSTNSGLRVWPEGNRAILLAGATRNVEDQTWWEDVSDGEDAADGTGALNALESHRIARQRASRDNRPSRRGWDVGRLSSSDFDGNGLSKFSYRVQVPDLGFLLGPRRVKVALAWTSDVTTLDEIFPWWPLPQIPVTSALSVDLDLLIEDAQGTLVGYSGSWDNSYEIAEFTGVRGSTYGIRIRRWSGSRSTWYGIAWTVTGGLLVDHVGGTDLLRAARRLAQDV
jgi:Subtilase family